MNTFYGACEKCGQPVYDSNGPAFPVTGWEVLRQEGGANQIKQRERVPNRVRHVQCLPTARINEGQESMALDDQPAVTNERVGYDGRYGSPGF